jgi:hypothetical protein
VTKLLNNNLNPDCFSINASNRLSPLLELKGLKTNSGLSIDLVTKLLNYNLNPDYIHINASNQLLPVFQLKGFSQPQVIRSWKA